jgi:hypothetical protein
MAKFDSSIYTRGADRAAQQSRDLQSTLMQLGQQYQQQQQFDAQLAEAKRKEQIAVAQASLEPEAVYAKAVQFGVESLTPQEKAAYQSAQALQGGKMAVDPLGRAYQAYSPVPLPQSQLATQAMPQGAPQAMPQQMPQATPQEMPQSSLQAGVMDSPAVQLELGKQLAKGEAKEVMAAREKARLKPKEEFAFKKLKFDINNIDKKIDKAIEQSTFWTTGLMGETVGKVAGTKASDLRANLKTIQSDAAFGRLQEMRDASKTGGALGSVSEKELSLLQNAREALEASQSEAQFEENLKNYQRIRRNALNNVAEAYKIDYGAYPADFKPYDIEEQEAPQETPEVLGAPEVGMIRRGYRFKGGDHTKESSWELIK